MSTASGHLPSIGDGIVSRCDGFVKPSWLVGQIASAEGETPAASVSWKFAFSMETSKVILRISGGERGSGKRQELLVFRCQESSDVGKDLVAQSRPVDQGAQPAEFLPQGSPAAYQLCAGHGRDVPGAPSGVRVWDCPPVPEPGPPLRDNEFRGTGPGVSEAASASDLGQAR